MCPILQICCEAFLKFILYSIILFGSIVHMLVAVRPFVYISINKKIIGYFIFLREWIFILNLQSNFAFWDLNYINLFVIRRFVFQFLSRHDPSESMVPFIHTIDL